MAKTVLDYISDLPKELQAEIISQVEKDNTTLMKEEAQKAKAAIKLYYKIKEEIAAELLKKLKGTDLALRAEEGRGVRWSASKILKIIGTLPARQPNTDAGYLTADRNIVFGKKRRVSAEAKAKKDAKQEAAAMDTLLKRKEKREAKVTEAADKVKKGKLKVVRKTMFKKPVSNRKAAADAKKKASPSKTKAAPTTKESPSK